MNAKLDIGQVFARTFQVYRQQFTLLAPLALLIFLPVAVISGLILSGSVGALEWAISLLVSLIATYWYQGIVVSAAEDMLDGRRDETVGSLLSKTAPLILPLLAAGLLAGIGITIGLFLLVIPGLFLITIWALIAPVIVLERSGVIGAFGRSRELVKGNGWPVFGVLVLLFILTAVASMIIGGLLRAIDDNVVTVGLGDLIVRVLLTPLSALAAAVMYFGVKQIKEGQPAPSAPAPSGGPESPVPAPTGSAPQPPPGGPPQAPPPGS